MHAFFVQRIFKLSRVTKMFSEFLVKQSYQNVSVNFELSRVTKCSVNFVLSRVTKMFSEFRVKQSYQNV